MFMYTLGQFFLTRDSVALEKYIRFDYKTANLKPVKGEIRIGSDEQNKSYFNLPLLITRVNPLVASYAHRESGDDWRNTAVIIQDYRGVPMISQRPNWLFDTMDLLGTNFNDFSRLDALFRGEDVTIQEPRPYRCGSVTFRLGCEMPH